MATANENMTVVVLRALAKDRGFKRYSSLNKADLLRLLENGNNVLIPNLPNENIMDAPIPDIGVPIIKPFIKESIYSSIKKKLYSRLTKRLNNESIMNAPIPDIGVPILRPSILINKFTNWVLNVIPQKPKTSVSDVSEKLKELKLIVTNLFKKYDKNEFKIRETKSALK